IPTEEVLCILISVLLSAVFFQLISKSRATSHILLFFLMAIQVVNAVFHIFFSLYYFDFSPGTITAIFLYLPINFLIIQSAFREGLLKNTTELIIIFILGTSTFVLFELLGPKVWLVSFFMCFIYYFWMRKISSIV
ncbi:MAG: HXXEE domain-containing protein, partial [bacterium]